MPFRFCQILAMIGALLTFPAAAQEIHADLCLFGCPSGSPASNDIIIRDIYILSSNDMTKLADWVAYRVTKATIGATQNRDWKADPFLDPDETLEPEDYAGANATLRTDRGHQAPLASFTSTPNWKATNFLSNITPQKSALNQGVWLKLESAVRTLAQKPGTEAVYVMTGPFYEKNMPPLPKADEAHLVPSGYWKIVAIQDGNMIKVAAFIFDQETPRNAELCEAQFIASARTIELKTGLNFFHALEPAQQDTIETGPSALLPDLGCSP